MLGWLPENVSTYGGTIDSIFYGIYYLTTTIFILVALTMVVFLIRYRRREGRQAAYTHGNTTLEIVWTVATALIMVVLAFISKPVWGTIKQQIPSGDVQVQVTGKQFNWEVVYPGPDREFGTADDLQLENEVHVPVNRVVRVGLKSKDVIHSFFVPNFRLKQDAVPGREIPAWFEVTRPGKYELACAELCGFGHSGMRGWVFVHSEEEYQQWVKEQWPSP
ncbi:MAG: cytochrome c oxidase subunit II [Candidatus Latescibacteria bacterium]|nr:cytochrome c oxidase subunit II [Candidatus Latescibacterota bacterium]